MRKLIINADDLGISLEVDERIEECINRGVITSSTLMANAPAFEDGVRIAKQYPQISVGVHLNIIEFSPLTNVDIFKKHGVLGEDGNFVEGAIYCVHLDDELKKAIFEEWDAQISKIEAVGILPTHCDSHQHTHTIPELQEGLCNVLKKHGIKCVRRKREPSMLQMLCERRRPAVKLDKSKAMVQPKRNVFYRRLHLLSIIRACRKWNKKIGVSFHTADSFFEFNSFFYNRSALHLGGRNSVIELMCHPGHKAYQNETDNLMNGLSWLPKHYNLITYKEL